MNTVIIDYNSGNLRSAEKSFARMAVELNAGNVTVSSKPEEIAKADRIVLPGVGSFADCRRELGSIDGLFGAIEEKVRAGTPFMGICVGMQMMASWGHEYGRHAGFDWIKGQVEKLSPSNNTLKIPHMGWNELNFQTNHPVFSGLNNGDHAYFVHSYHFVPDQESDLLATVDYGGKLTAAVGHDNIIGTQFHPEKSQATGLRLIGNFLTWSP